MTRWLIGCCVIPLGLALPMHAQSPREPVDVSRLGPQVGDVIPRFSLPDQWGETQTLESLAGPSGLMLVFHRSADW